MVATQIEGANVPRLKGEYLTDLSMENGTGEAILLPDPNFGKVRD